MNKQEQAPDESKVMKMTTSDSHRFALSLEGSSKSSNPVLILEEALLSRGCNLASHLIKWLLIRC